MRCFLVAARCSHVSSGLGVHLGLRLCSSSGSNSGNGTRPWRLRSCSRSRLRFISALTSQAVACCRRSRVQGGSALKRASNSEHSSTVGRDAGSLLEAVVSVVEDFCEIGVGNRKFGGSCVVTERERYMPSGWNKDVSALFKSKSTKGEEREGTEA